MRKTLIAACAVAMLAVPATADAGNGLTLKQAKQATKKYAMTYQAGLGMEITKLTCKRTSARTAKCKFELRAPEKCRGTVAVKKRNNGKIVAKGQTECQVMNPDGTFRWE